MSIAFNCTQCGKHYELSESLAGKKGKCKACGNMMTIPMPQPAPDLGGGHDPFGLEEAAEPAAGRGGKQAPAADAYGIDDEPALAPLSRRPYQASAESAPAAAKPKKKKKASSSKSESNTGRNVLGVSFGGIVAFILIGLRFYNALGIGLTSRNEVEQYFESEVAMMEQLGSLMKTVNDQPTASAAIPQMLAVIDRQIAYAKKVKNAKARQTDIDQLKKKLEARSDAATRVWESECMRVALVPGGLATLRAAATRLADLSEIQTGKRPTLDIPTMPPADTNLPQMPPGFSPNVTPSPGMPNLPAGTETPGNDILNPQLPGNATPGVSPGAAQDNPPPKRPTRKIGPRRLRKPAQ